MPPTTQVRTDLIISAQTKGFDKALRETLGLNAKALDGLRAEAAAFGKVDEKIKGLRGRVSQLAKDQLELSRSMAAVGDKGSAAFQEMETRLRALRQESRAAVTEAGLLTAAFEREAQSARKLAQATQQVERQRQADRHQARGAFSQGFLQTTMPKMAGMFLDRGPGMRRQALGQLAGMGVRRGMGGVGSFLSTPFSGLEGLQGSLAALPGGGLLAGQLGASAGYAGQALQYQRDRLAFSPFVGGSDLGARRGVRARAETALPAAPAAGGGSLWKRSAGVEEAIDLRAARTRAAGGSKDDMIDAFFRQIGGKAGAAIQRSIGIPEAMIEKQAGMARPPMAGGRAVTRGAVSPLSVASANGGRLSGLSRHQTLQFTSELMRASGGRYGEGLPGEAGQQERMLGAALSAQTMFGVGAGVSGAFGGAGRRAGSLVGAGGKGAEALTGALQDALEQGLEGSEVTTYLEQMARGIQAWEQTGIPVNAKSLKELGLEISSAGIAGTRAARMAGGMQQYVQGIGQRGVQSGMDLLLLQKMGGFQGKGAQDYERAVMNLEQMGGDLAAGKFGPRQQEIVRQLVQMGGGARGGGLSFMRQKLAPMMGPMGLHEAAAMAQKSGLETGISEEEFRAAGIDIKAEGLKIGRGKEKAREIGSVEDLMREAAKRVQEMAPNLAKQAAVQNQQLEVGQRILGTVQSLEMATSMTNEAFLHLAGPTLSKVSTAMEDFARALKDLTGGPDGLLRGLARLAVTGLGS